MVRAADQDPTGLPVERCMTLLTDVSVGRIGWSTSDGSVTIIPVNFAVDEDAIVLRTSETVAARLLAAGAAAAFQADELEPAVHAGWSVLVHGAVERVVDAAEVDRINELVQPWTGTDTHVALRLLPQRISGREIPVQAGGVFIIHEH